MLRILSAADFARHAPGARLFHAFDRLGWENFDIPRCGDTVADLFYCGSAGEAQHTVEKLIEEIGVHYARLGDLDQIRLVDAVTGRWFALAIGQKKGRQLASEVLTRWHDGLLYLDDPTLPRKCNEALARGQPGPLLRLCLPV